MKEKIKEVVIEDASNAKASVQDAARSGTFLYPFKGIIFMATHKPLWHPLTSRATQTLTIGMGVTSFMFLFTYIPQATVLTFTSGPIVAPFSAALLVLTESSNITNYIARMVLSFQDALTDTFDATLVANGQDALVSEGRQLKSGADSDPMGKLGRILKPKIQQQQQSQSTSFWDKIFHPTSLIRSLIYWPLNLVPFIGTVLYIVVQGMRMGPVAHERYFRLKGWEDKKREKWVLENRGGYTSFGVTAFLLEMVPFASMAFSFTNTVGAALWAADIESASV